MFPNAKAIDAEMKKKRERGCTLIFLCNTIAFS
jgi:hypothetical protein